MKDSIFENLYLGENLPYLRPYICKGNPYEAKVFLTGINPATPIYPSQIKIQEYIKMIKGYETFINFYKENRRNQNKKEISRTRMGINSLVNWIENECNTKTVETDIFTYPTQNIKELLKADNGILNKSIEKFWEVLLEFKPNIIILYGSLTINTFKRIVEEKQGNIVYFNKSCNKIEELEKLYPFATLNIEDKNIDVLVCRHLMYYGKKGNSFEALRKNIKNILGIER